MAIHDQSEPRAILLEELLSGVRNGVLRIPEFQRAFQWQAEDVQQLFDSVLRNYPIGTLLLWEKEEKAGDVHWGPLTVPAQTMPNALTVVDGQQRITSLAAGLLGDPNTFVGEHARFAVFVDLAEPDFVVRVPRSREKHGEYWFPLTAAVNQKAFVAWLKLHEDAPEEVQSRANEIAQRVRSYRLSTYVIRGAELPAAKQIFDRMNNAGRSLKAETVFAALSQGVVSQSPKELQRVVSAQGFGELKEALIVYALLVALGKDVTRGVNAAIREAVKHPDIGHVHRALMRAVRFMIDSGIPHVDLCPFPYVLVPLTRFFHVFPDPHPRNLVLLRRWLWRSLAAGAFKGDRRPHLRAARGAFKDTDSEDAAVQELLGRVAREVPQVNLGRRFDPRGSDARLAMLVQVSSGVPLAVFRSLMDGKGTARLVDQDALHGASDGVANRVLAQIDPPVLQTYLASKEFRPVEGLAPHGMTPLVLDALRDEDSAKALELRSAELQRLVTTHVAARAEWHQNDRPPLRRASTDADAAA